MQVTNEIWNILTCTIRVVSHTIRQKLETIQKWFHLQIEYIIRLPRVREYFFFEIIGQFVANCVPGIECLEINKMENCLERTRPTFEGCWWKLSKDGNIPKGWQNAVAAHFLIKTSTTLQTFKTFNFLSLKAAKKETFSQSQHWLFNFFYTDHIHDFNLRTNVLKIACHLDVSEFSCHTTTGWFWSAILNKVVEENWNCLTINGGRNSWCWWITLFKFWQ